jgi:hypothetical protein
MTNREAPANVSRKWNWRIWSGFLLAAAGGLLVAGVRSAFANPEVYRGKIVGLILAVLSFGAAGLFAYATLYASRQLPAAAGAPAVGDRAPEFALADTTGRMVALSMLLSEPMPGIQGGKPRGVLLIFYRG